MYRSDRPIKTGVSAPGSSPKSIRIRLPNLSRRRTVLRVKESAAQFLPGEGGFVKLLDPKGESIDAIFISD
jgi:hypothetical protein